MAEAAQSSVGSTALSYRHGVILVLLAGVFWSTMGLGIRYIEAANVWHCLLYTSDAADE